MVMVPDRSPKLAYPLSEVLRHIANCKEERESNMNGT